MYVRIDICTTHAAMSYLLYTAFLLVWHSWNTATNPPCIREWS